MLKKVRPKYPNNHQIYRHPHIRLFHNSDQNPKPKKSLIGPWNHLEPREKKKCHSFVHLRQKGQILMVAVHTAKWCRLF